MHRALQINEVLARIFQECAPSTLASCIRVCKWWLEAARDCLYRDMEFLNLCTVLAPMIFVGTANKQFDRPPTPEDWRRASPYFARVRSIRYGLPGRPVLRPESFFDLVATAQASMPIFPKLRKLEWKVETLRSLFYCMLCLHPHLETLIITLPFLETQAVSSFISHIKERAPLLQELSWCSSIPASFIQPAFADLLCNLKHLHVVTIPRFYLTASNFAALGSLPHLRSIYVNRTLAGREADVGNFDSVIEDGMFPALESLPLDIDLHSAASFVQSKFMPSTLNHLEISALYFESPETIHHFFNCLSAHCPRLIYLHLYLLICPDTDLPTHPNSDITLATLRPLLELKELQTLIFYYNFPLQLTDDDIETIATAWPKLISCYLNEEPLLEQQTTTSLSLACLKSFATHCPNIEEIGLFLDATHIPSIALDRNARLDSLEVLNFGVSPIEDHRGIALWLSDLTVNTELEISTDKTWPDSVLPNIVPALRAEVETRSQRWSLVDGQLPILQQLRMQERQRSIHLWEQLDDIKGEVSVLQDGLERVRKELSQVKHRQGDVTQM